MATSKNHGPTVAPPVSQITKAPSIAGEIFGALLDAEQHLAFHDQTAGFHDQHVEHANRQRRAWRRDPVPADQPGPAVLGDERKDPHPVPVGEPDHERPLRVADLDLQDRPAGAKRHLVAHLEVLELREDLTGAVHIEAEQVLDPVVGVRAAASAAHLHQPRPHPRAKRRS